MNSLLRSGIETTSGPPAGHIRLGLVERAVHRLVQLRTQRGPEVDRRPGSGSPAGHM